MESVVNRRNRVVNVAAMAAAAAILVAGCAQQPHDVTLPDLIWDNGIKPSSPLETHPDVVFAREISLAWAYAYGAGDFSFTTLVSGVPAKDIQDLYISWIGRSDSESSFTYPGPYPFQPISIQPFEYERDSTDMTFSILHFCSIGTSPWIERGWVPENTGIFDPALARTGYMIIAHRPDGSRINFGTNYGQDYADLGSWQPCDGTQVPVGRFDPPFPLPDGPARDTPYPPLDYSNPYRK
jgi:hypothetical protein